MVEIWSTGFLGVPSLAGSQYAELNANHPGSLSQDLATVPGQKMSWRLSHRGRSGVDVMQLSIGAPGGALVAQVPKGRRPPP